ncbi:MAG: hypothetical protein JNK22_01595 [Rhodocyclaceae bacterium]|nr:hypothetical protein [Rhodocyclaceae bacterium]
MRAHRTAGLLASLVLMAGCGGFEVPTRLDGNLPRQGSVIPDTNLQLTPSFGVTLEKLIYWGGAAAVAYLVLDPLAPNWEIQEARFPADHVHLSMQMKRYYAGGAGEARVVFHRRAKQLMRDGGFDGYRVVEYNEGMESSVLGSRRTGEGVILLTRGTG